MVANFAALDGADLYTQVSGAESGPDVLLLHGLFGMGSNLGALARALADRYRVHQIDLPNHGRSPWEDVSTIATLAAAVAAYARTATPGPYSLLGHSLGGKVAMQLALSAPEQLRALVVADIAPVSYPPSHDRVFAAIRAVDAVAVASRAEARAIMERHVDEAAVVQFLLLSLARDDEGRYRWRFNWRALEENYTSLREAPAAAEPCPAPALFVYGALSAYVGEAGIAAARQLFPAAQFERLEGAGHWLHAEKPQAFNDAVRHFLDRLHHVPA